MTISHAPRRSNVAGAIGLILAIITVALNIVNSYVGVIVPYASGDLGLNPTMVGFILNSGRIVAFVLAIATLTLGIVGATRRDAPILTSGISIGVGGFGVVLSLVAFTLPTVLRAMYSL